MHYFKRLSLFLLLVIAITAITVLIYSPSFNSSFHLDDYDGIANARLQYTTPHQIIQKYPTRWLVFLSFSANARIHGTDVTGYHIVNIFIHICNALLVFLLTRVLCIHLMNRIPDYNDFLNPVWCSCIVALLFVVHPLQSQSVIYITQRFMLMASLMYLGALYAVARAYLPGNSRSFGWIIACLCILLGLFCKEIIVTVPLLIIIMVWIFISPPDFSSWKIKRWITAGVILFAFCVLPVILFLHLCHWDPKQLQSALHSVGGPIDSHTTGLTRYTYFLTQPSVLLQYLMLFLVPFGLNIDHDIPLCSHIYSPQFILPVIIFTLLFWFAWHIRRTSPFILWGLLVFIFPLLPQSSIVPTRDLMFEHRAYIGTLGLLFVVIGILNELFLFVRKITLSRILCGLGVISVIILGTITFQRNKIWKTELSLWADAYTKSPDKQRVIINFSSAVLEVGQTDTAINIIESKMSSWNRTLPGAYYLLGNAYMSKGNTAIAVSNYTIAVKHDRTNPDIRYNLAVAYYTIGKEQLTFHQLRQIISDHPEYADAYLLRGYIFSKSPKRHEKAVNDLNRYLELIPDGSDADTAHTLLEQIKDSQ